MRKVLTGPQGVRIVLDSAEIFPDDPGAGAPAIVEVGPESGTFWCAIDTGELICGPSGCYTLNASQLNWLQAQEYAVGEFMEENTPK
jgi:hypothetical protein